MNMSPAVLEANVARIRERIATSCARAGRDESGVRLVAVSKFASLEAVRTAAGLGVTDLGESRPQELERKARAFPGARNDGTVRWHAIGPIQRNKAKLVVEHADLVHSLDSVKLARALSARVQQLDRPTRLPCLVQVNISGESAKSGFAAADVVRGVTDIAQLKGLEVLGLMGMASFEPDPELTRPQFAALRALAADVAALQIPGVQMRELSMGMSNDFEVAIEEGATLVRVGTAIFGERDS